MWGNRDDAANSSEFARALREQTWIRSEAWILFDTDVLIDCLRSLLSAGRQLPRSSEQGFGVPGIVGMELVMSCRDKTELSQVQALIRRFKVF